jgi:hypothetical protein
MLELVTVLVALTVIMGLIGTLIGEVQSTFGVF